MLRAAALVCVAMLTMQAMAARTLLHHSVSRSACTDDGTDGGSTLIADEALAARRVVIARPPVPRQSRWDGPQISAVASPAPDEILHVPKALLA
jgi:hypothetical protein